MISYNIKFPIRDDVERNYFLKMNTITKDAFASDLLLLLLTEKGQKWYDPNYGSFLVKFLFEPDDNLLQSDITKDIKETVSTYIPQLTISNVLFKKINSDDNDIEQHGVNVHIDFVYKEGIFEEQGEIDLNF